MLADAVFTSIVLLPVAALPTVIVGVPSLTLSIFEPVPVIMMLVGSEPPLSLTLTELFSFPPMVTVAAPPEATWFFPLPAAAMETVEPVPVVIWLLPVPSAATVI